MNENQNENEVFKNNSDDISSADYITCPSCGGKVSKTDEFCMHCGANLTAYNESGMKSIKENKKHSSRFVVWLITLAVALVLLIPVCSVLIPGFSVSTENNSDSSSEESNTTTAQVTTSIPELTTITRGTMKESTTVTTATEITTTPATTTTTEETTKATTTTTEATTKATTTTAESKIKETTATKTTTEAITTTTGVTTVATTATSKAAKTIEITFRDVPWGVSYTEAKALLSDLELWEMSGEELRTFSIDEIILGDYKGISFEKTDINIIGWASNSHISVAGYTTESVYLYFAYVPVNGVITKSVDDSALYGARYEFEPEDLSKASSDLKSKLSSLYGEPDSYMTDSDDSGNKYTYYFWTGANDTEVVLKIRDSSESIFSFYDDEIYISYVWLKGDELLQTACDTLIQNEKDAESDVYGDGSTGGL